ncbi:ATP-binding cassette sub-family G member 2 [Histoplasma capsulatum var. duboisii H88]|uniref:ATP-binding cassette sub-family G member 2 n=1 Tax=Ajellomyces capsulatus (strain H88) TaxID=544711 RepID=F0UDI0_AJEC8|nr:ATP-binding cassette sub-family G member 2 [Histoplasma capsulatum var. duboisii H88]
MRPPSLASSLLYASILASSSLPWLASAFSNYSDSSPLLSSRVLLQDDRPKDCPPCFNCELEAFQCHQFAACNKYNGKCDCPAGFGGDDCTLPLCGSLPDGKERAPRKGKYCNCTEGWEGVNCNVCKTDNVCNSMMPEGEGGVCYKDGVTQKENYQMCAVTNRKIVDMLGDQKPEVTFSCKESDHKCNFQFWVDQVESFYCNLDTCKWGMESTYSQNKTTYTCENKDALDLSDFLKEEIKGPATFTSTSTLGGSSEDGSRFSEPVMNDMIKNIFGDPAIFLACRSGECLYKTDLPGYKPPVKVINTPLISGVIASCSLFIVAVIMGVWYLSRRSAYRDYISLPLDDSDDEGAKLMVDHKPASLHFENVAYYLNGRQILSGIQGSAHPGQLMAIMGASGAGKTTFLDILARKNKRGTVEGVFYVNGEKVDDDEYRSVIGFVDQEDTMLPTLTVHETILTSALLRLPRNMSRAAKEQKVFEVEKQLGIYHIKDQIIGSEEGRGRGISGGEKRRVGIACELVTSPSILFLDEPTSGLDAFNAFNVVECLVTLAKNFNRTVIFTIHQPRSNIVALFDQLILLAEGKTVYSGPFASCQPYFDHIGYSCPSGFNIADYLVDLTMHASNTHSRYEDEIHLDVNHDAARTATSSLRAVKSIASVSNASVDNSSSDRPNESGFRPISKRKESLKQRQDKQLYTRRRAAEVGTPSTLRTEDEEHIVGSLSGNGQHRSRQPNNVTLRVLDDPDQPPPSSAGFGTDLDHLVSSYIESNVAASVRDEINAAVNMAAEANGCTSSGLEANGSLNKSMTGYAKVGLYRQFTILSQRTWRNLYRNPMLMLTHYAIAIVLAVLSGFLFYGLTDDIKGFQNRLGLFFFLLALFGFSTLTSLNVFSTERLLFVRERANGYYSPITYFASKVAFDIVPLRLIPPILMGIIVYPMVGLIPAWPEFLRFMLILLLFNLAAACICLTIGIVFKDSSVANLMGSLVMLFSLLFAGLLLNRDAIPKSALWLQVLSIFHYGFEGLIVNEVTYLTLIDHKYGLDIEVPGASILSAFGFNTLGLWHDVIGLGIFSGVFIVIAYAAMHFLLVEKR